MNMQQMVKNSKPTAGPSKPRFTTDEIEAALDTLQELVLHQTGLPAERIKWTIEDVRIDLVRILTGAPLMKQAIADMRQDKAQSLF